MQATAINGQQQQIPTQNVFFILVSNFSRHCFHRILISAMTKMMIIIKKNDNIQQVIVLESCRKITSHNFLAHLIRPKLTSTSMAKGKCGKFTFKKEILVYEKWMSIMWIPLRTLLLTAIPSFFLLFIFFSRCFFFVSVCHDSHVFITLYTNKTDSTNKTIFNLLHLLSIFNRRRYCFFFSFACSFCM